VRSGLDLEVDLVCGPFRERRIWVSRAATGNKCTSLPLVTSTSKDPVQTGIQEIYLPLEPAQEEVLATDHWLLGSGLVLHGFYPAARFPDLPSGLKPIAPL
jgi:hypothetical protein